MQSEKKMEIIKDGDTVKVVPSMPEMRQIGEDFNQFAREADECVANLKKHELETAIKKQADVMKFLTEMLHG